MLRVRRHGRNPACPVNVTVEIIGDPWSLIVIRDIVFYGKHSFREFLSSPERITTSVLADRLALLTGEGILHRSTDVRDRRREHYALTTKGLDLIPLLIELANWGVLHGDGVVPDRLWVDAARADPQGLRDLIRSTVADGGSVWTGENSVVSQLALTAGVEDHVHLRR